MAITKIGGRQIDVEKSPLSSSNYDSSTLKDLDGGLTLTGSVRLTHAPSNDLDAATKAYVDASTGASVAAGFVAFGDSDGSGLEGSGRLMYLELGNADLPPGDESRLALSGSIGLGNTVNVPDLLLSTASIGGAENTGLVGARQALVLSSSTGVVHLHDDGVNFGSFVNSSSDLIVSQSVSNKDIIFKTNEGGTATEVFRVDGSASSVLVASGKEIQFADTGEAISGDGTDLTVKSGAKINLTATSDVILPDSVGMLFGDVAVGGEKIEGDGTDLTIASSAKINLTATSDVILPDSVGMLFGDVAAGGEKIEGDGTDLTIASSAKINLTATSDVILPNSVGMLFGDVAAGGEKIEGDGTDLTVASSAKINLTATSDVILPNSVGMLFGDVAAGGEKIEGNGTDLFINSSQNLFLSASTNISIPQGISLTFDDGGPAGSGDVIQGSAVGLLVTSSYLQLGGGQQLDISCGDGAVITLTDGAAFVNSSKTMQVQSSATLALANGAAFSAAAGSNSSFAGAVTAGDATSFELPRYIRNTFQYTSASAAASGSVFTRLHGGANFQFNHSNDNTGAGTSEGSTFTLQATDTYNFTPTVDTFNVYLNGVRLMSGSGLDYFVTGSAILAGTKPCLIVDFQNVLLNTGDTVVIDFQAPSA